MNIDNLNYSGIASVLDFENKEWNNIYSEMEKFQQFYLSKEKFFRSKEYIWPSDALHNWSRLWEYPYVYFHISKFINNSSPHQSILDVGSGVTFFPLYLAKQGLHVTVTDIDEIAEKDINRSLSIFDTTPGSIKFKLCSENSLPFDNESFDIVLSVSVIEHVHDFNNNISEIYRVLKKDGLLILTFDIDLNGNYELTPRKYIEFIDVISKYFIIENKDRTTHPNYYLTNLNSPYPFPAKKNFFLRKFKNFKNIIKKVFGIQFFKPGYLTVQGMVLRKK